MTQHKGAVVWSLVLHVAALGFLMTGITMPQRPRIEVATAPIVGTLVDTATLERQQQARAEAARQERQRQQREEAQRRQAEEQRRQAQQREEQRIAAEQQRAREQAAQKERERVAAEKAAQERREQQAREERERQAAAEKERQAQAQRERERAAQRAREEDMLRAAALEAEANAARNAGLLDQYILMIENRIKQHWDRPLSARPGIDCIVNVVQLPTGDVVSARVATCNGDDAVRRSIERAVMEASPLPKPPNPALFERNLVVNFKPDE
jgi:colicin import membrane protein